MFVIRFVITYVLTYELTLVVRLEIIFVISFDFKAEKIKTYYYNKQKSTKPLDMLLLSRKYLIFFSRTDVWYIQIYKLVIN